TTTHGHRSWPRGPTTVDGAAPSLRLNVPLAGFPQRGLLDESSPRTLKKCRHRPGAFMPACPFRFSPRRRCLLVALGWLSVACELSVTHPAPSRGQGIALIVPAPVGGSADHLARIVADALATI